MKKLNRKCPVCSCEDGEILHHQKFQLSDDSILPNSYDLVACSNCAFVFADTTGNQELYNKYYSEYSKYEETNSLISTGGNTIWVDKRSKNVAKDVSEYCPKEATIIDIGCANGVLLSELKKIGYNNLFGLDPSKACVKYVNSLGFTCYLGELFEAEKYLNGKKFDFIILSHVLEHIYDVKKAATILKGLLNENGMIYIEVPDASNYSNYYIVPYYYFDSEHINHFDDHSLINLFQSVGFDLVNTKNKFFYVNETKCPSVHGIFKKVPVKKPFSIIKDETVKKEIQKYIELSINNSATTEIEKLVNSREPVIVFGAGNFTARLLETTPLKDCNIVAYVDNDKKKHQTTFNNKPVYSPDFVKNFTGTIMVCSALFYNQIADQLKNQIGAKNNIVIIK